jgi:hypothetical protein
MKARHYLAAVFTMVASQSLGLTPPSASDGPVRLLTCTVSPQGILQAEVDNQTDDAMNCNIRCNYELSERMFSQSFNVTIPGRFHGRVGRFDTSNAKAGNYSGELGTCKKSPR